MALQSSARPSIGPTKAEIKVSSSSAEHKQRNDVEQFSAAISAIRRYSKPALDEIHTALRPCTRVASSRTSNTAERKFAGGLVEDAGDNLGLKRRAGLEARIVLVDQTLPLRCWIIMNVSNVYSATCAQTYASLRKATWLSKIFLNVGL
jgi:hypothetical protein